MTLPTSPPSRCNMSDEIDGIIVKLTKAQRRCLIERGVIVLRNRWDTRIAINLERLGVAERGRHLNQFVYTELGLAVRSRLSSMEVSNG